MKRSRPLSVTLPPAGVLFAESIHAGNFHMPVRTDPFHKVVYVGRGVIAYAEQGRPVERVPGGMVLLVPAGVEHTIADEQASTLFLLCFDGAFLAQDPELPALWAALTGRSERRIALTRPTRHQVESVWRRAMLERTRPRPGATTTIRALAAQMLVTLARVPATHAPSDPAMRVTAVVRELDATFCEEWDLDRGAMRAGLSRRHFSMLFRKVTGRTFGEHLTSLRLTHATRLLAQGGHSVTGVVFSCGFGDVSQFYRLFRERFRLPPRQWALRAQRDGSAPATRAAPRRLAAAVSASPLSPLSP